MEWRSGPFNNSSTTSGIAARSNNLLTSRRTTRSGFAPANAPVLSDECDQTGFPPAENLLPTDRIMYPATLETARSADRLFANAATFHPAAHGIYRRVCPDP